VKEPANRLSQDTNCSSESNQCLSQYDDCLSKHNLQGLPQRPMTRVFQRLTNLKNVATMAILILEEESWDKYEPCLQVLYRSGLEIEPVDKQNISNQWVMKLKVTFSKHV